MRNVCLCSVANAGEFTPSWANKDVNSVPAFTPSFNTGMNTMYAQPMPMSRTSVIAKAKPLTLSSLGVGKIGGGGAKSLSLSASQPTPAPAPAPVAAPITAPAVKKEVAEKPITPKQENKPAAEPLETVESLDTPEEAVEPETSAPVVSTSRPHK